MSEKPMVQGFLIAYRAAFESLDVAAIEELFSYPRLITSGADRIEVTVVPARKEWLPQLERLVAAYRGIGVRSAEPRRLMSRRSLRDWSRRRSAGG